MKKLAIVGTAETWKETQFNNEEFEIWALNDMFMMIPYADRWFEMHTRKVIEECKTRGGDQNYLEWFQKASIPIYMQEKHDDIPNSIKYPLDEMIERFGVRYFNSTVDYEIALALSEGYKEIHVNGVNMAVDKEYGEQRPSCEFWLGVAKGMGVKLVLPESCDLLSSRWLYGYEDEPRNIFESKIQCKISALKAEAMEAEKSFYLITGHKQALENILKNS
jgi:hypothetical protein